MNFEIVNALNITLLIYTIIELYCLENNDFAIILKYVCEVYSCNHHVLDIKTKTINKTIKLSNLLCLVWVNSMQVFGM